MIYAPVVIPTLCRATHFIRLMESLKRNTWARYTEVYVALDYPPSDKYKRGWQEICEYLEGADFSIFKKITVFKRNQNFGALRNYTDLIQYVCKHYDCWIQTDDDCEFSENFLEYIDKCLFRYEKDDSIVAVTGYSYPIDWEANEKSTCFLQNFNVSTWGLGLWKKKYIQISEEISCGNMLKKVKKCVKRESYKQMLDACVIEYFDAATTIRRRPLMTCATDVAMRAYLAVEGKYCVSPIVSKVRNYGFDGSGCYCSDKNANSDCEAQRYDYSKQVIDNNNGFEIRLDVDDNHMNDNRQKLNAFDSRSSSKTMHAYHIIWLIKHFGLNFAIVYHNICLLFRKAKKLIEKYRTQQRA